MIDRGQILRPGPRKAYCNLTEAEASTNFDRREASRQRKKSSFNRDSTNFYFIIEINKFWILKIIKQQLEQMQLLNWNVGDEVYLEQSTREYSILHLEDQPDDPF